MAVGSRDRQPMLATGRYPQRLQAVEATDDSPAVPEHTTVETPMNMSPENKAHFKAEKEAIHLILTRIGDEIYSTVDAFNELRAERLARNANPLALVATAQASQDPYYQSSRSHRSQAPSSKPSIPTRSHSTTRHKGKEIAKSITPPSEKAFEKDIDPEQAQRDKDMQKNLALIAKYFKKIYKPTNNNLKTSSNSKNKNVDTALRFKNDSQSGQFGNQRKVNVAAARDNVGSQVVQQFGIQCFNCREFGHFAKECRKPKRVKDSAYHKEKMLLCKQAEQCVSLQAEQASRIVETDDSNVILDSPDMCEDDIQNEQNDVESDDERVVLANLIANLKLDVDENKKIQKQLKKANTTLAQELKETLNANDVCATCNKCLVDSNHFAYVTKMLNDVHDRTKKPKVVPIVSGYCSFGNDQFALILGYGDLVQGNVTINRVYYVKGLNHTLFLVGQFCDANLEVAFRKSTCFVRDLRGNDLLTGNRGSDLYTISIQESTSSTPLCLMAKSSPTQAWLWHRRLSHLNFDYINLLSKKDIVIGLPKLSYVKDQLCSSYELSKVKRSSFKSKVVPSLKRMLNLLHIDLCGPMRVASINGKKYILMIVDDYSRYTWTLFLRSKDETPKVWKEFLIMIQRNLQAQ
uniref:Integrase, catalytic region, zinc finger, CCHC-type, peptidase aspartic, catalytic n=1 Tax=Tanacetum cinerariifolium TaxID=118510 RepID=A0A6L2NDR4_TANCI|nr:integrase, catalytic region, zinc finger, CCHC-type, peptidase aspartic, catalytic [Tanacetum cinerariifolium]